MEPRHIAHPDAYPKRAVWMQDKETHKWFLGGFSDGGEALDPRDCEDVRPPRPKRYGGPALDASQEEPARADEVLRKHRVAKQGYKWMRDKETGKWSNCAIPSTSNSNLIGAQDPFHGNTISRRQGGGGVSIHRKHSEERGLTIVTKSPICEEDNQGDLSVAPEETEGLLYHTVKPTDTIRSICLKYNVSVKALRAANDIDRFSLKDGPEKLVIPSGVPEKVPNDSENEGMANVSQQREGGQKTRETSNSNYPICEEDNQGDLSGAPEEIEGVLYHTVKPTDTIRSICLKYEVSVKALRATNDIKRFSLKDGPEKLVIPSGMPENVPNDLENKGMATNQQREGGQKTREISNCGLLYHTVKPTDTIRSICLKYNVSVKALRAVNDIKRFSLKDGPEKLVIPAGMPEKAPNDSKNEGVAIINQQREGGQKTRETSNPNCRSSTANVDEQPGSMLKSSPVETIVSKQEGVAESIASVPPVSVFEVATQGSNNGEGLSGVLRVLQGEDEQVENGREEEDLKPSLRKEVVQLQNSSMTLDVEYAYIGDIPLVGHKRTIASASSVTPSPFSGSQEPAAPRDKSSDSTIDTTSGASLSARDNVGVGPDASASTFTPSQSSAMQEPAAPRDKSSDSTIDTASGVTSSAHVSFGVGPTTPPSGSAPLAPAPRGDVEKNPRPDDDDDDDEGDDDALYHWVEPGDSLRGICLMYNVGASDLRRANNLRGSNLEGAPKKLIIPKSSVSSNARRAPRGDPRRPKSDGNVIFFRILEEENEQDENVREEDESKLSLRNDLQNSSKTLDTESTTASSSTATSSHSIALQEPVALRKKSSGSMIDTTSGAISSTHRNAGADPEIPSSSSAPAAPVAPVPKGDLDKTTGLDDDVQYHWVEPGESLRGICLMYNVSASKIRRANNLRGSNLEAAPKKLIIPKSSVSRNARRAPCGGPRGSKAFGISLLNTDASPCSL